MGILVNRGVSTVEDGNRQLPLSVLDSQGRQILVAGNTCDVRWGFIQVKFTTFTHPGEPAEQAIDGQKRCGSIGIFGDGGVWQNVNSFTLSSQFVTGFYSSIIGYVDGKLVSNGLSLPTTACGGIVNAGDVECEGDYEMTYIELGINSYHLFLRAATQDFRSDTDTYYDCSKPILDGGLNIIGTVYYRANRVLFLEEDISYPAQYKIDTLKYLKHQRNITWAPQYPAPALGTYYANTIVAGQSVCYKSKMYFIIGYEPGNFAPEYSWPGEGSNWQYFWDVVDCNNTTPYMMTVAGIWMYDVIGLGILPVDWPGRRFTINTGELLALPNIINGACVAIKKHRVIIAQYRRDVYTYDSTTTIVKSGSGTSFVSGDIVIINEIWRSKATAGSSWVEDKNAWHSFKALQSGTPNNFFDDDAFKIDKITEYPEVYDNTNLELLEEGVIRNDSGTYGEYPYGPQIAEYVSYLTMEELEEYLAEQPVNWSDE